MKKILINAEPFDKQYAGIHYFIKLLREGLEKYYPEWPVYYIREIDNSGSDNDIYLPSRLGLRRDPIKHFFRIKKLVKKIKPDIYVEITHFGPFFKFPEVKKVTVIHDLTPILFPQYHPFLSAGMQKYFIGHTMRNADLIMSNSYYTRSDIISFFPQYESKTCVVYPGVENVFKPVPDRGLIQRLGIQRPYILSLSTIEPRKNLEGLLIAYERLRNRQEQIIQLVLAGKSGWKNKRFRALLDNHPYKKDIILTGYLNRDELPELYSHSEMFVFPTFYEGFGLPVLEAMLCNTPCVLSNVASLPEVAGNAALYFNPENYEEMSRSMEKLIKDKELRNSLVRNAEIRSSQFSLKKFADGFIENIEKL